MIILGVTPPFAGMLLFGIIGLPYELIFHLRLRKILKGLPVSDEKLTMAECKSAFSKSLTPVVLWVAEIFSLLLVAGGIKLIFFSGQDKKWGAVFNNIFGYFAYSTGRMLIIKMKSRSKIT